MKTMTEYDKQAESFCEKCNLLIIKHFESIRPYFDDDKKSRAVWKITFHKNHTKDKDFTFTFGNSISAGRRTPSDYDILACIQKNDIGTFENFCDDFGYDTDSRKDEKTYFAVQKEFAEIKKIFTPEEIELLQKIQ